MSMENDRSDAQGGDQVLVGEFALGLLDAAEFQRVGRRIAAEPALASEYRLWRTQLASLDGEYAEQLAPRTVLIRTEARLFGSARVERPSLWQSLALWRSIAAGGVAVAVAAIGFNLMQPPRLDPQEFATQLVAALQSQEGSGVEFVALYDTATGRVRLTALSGEVASDKDLELWYIKGDEPAVSMGVVPVGKTEIALEPEARAKFGEGIVLALTLEPKGGSPTGVATGPIVAVGAATAI